MAFRAGLIFLLAVFAGCSWTEKMSTYEATVKAQGREYFVVNKHGSMLIVEEPDGTKITSDDRGLPEQPGWFSNMMTIIGLKTIEDK